MQGMNMSARVTFLAAGFLFLGCGSAFAACAGAVAEFEKVIDGDVRTGNLNKGVHRRIAAELTRVQSECVVGHDAEAMRRLGAVKHRFGYH
jgi:hypothetical protein